MTSDRPYRKGTTVEAATEEIARCAGGQFDPKIVEVFCDLPAESWNELRAETERLATAALSTRLHQPVVA